MNTIFFEISHNSCSREISVVQSVLLPHPYFWLEPLTLCALATALVRANVFGFGPGGVLYLSARVQLWFTETQLNLLLCLHCSTVSLLVSNLLLICSANRNFNRINWFPLRLSGTINLGETISLEIFVFFINSRPNLTQTQFLTQS